MRFSVCAAGAFGAAFWTEWRTILGNVVWAGAVCGCVWIPDLAAVYVPVSACGRAAHSVQSSLSGDVWGRSGADVGRAEILYLFFLCDMGAGIINVIVKLIIDPHGHGQRLSPTIGASGAIYWNPSGVCGADAAPASVGVSATVDGVDANFCGVMGAIEFFATIGASGDNMSHMCHLGGCSWVCLFAARLVFVWDSQFGV